MTSEQEFIRKLEGRFPTQSPVETGIGDDGAVLNCDGEQRQVVVTDMLLDGTHFDLNTTSPFLAGRKAIAVNLSDLAAMACRPTAAFVSIAVPRHLPSADDFLTQLYDGMEELSKRYRFSIAGGDTNSWDGPFAINVTLTGVPCGTNPVLRSGAVEGDTLLVTGPLGGSLNSGRHLAFEPRLDAAAWLIANLDVHALMDISDGLSLDLARMMESSKAGAAIHGQHIPIHSDVTAEIEDLKRMERALNDGEDFELLVAVSTLPSDLQLPENIQLHQIGNVTSESEGCKLRMPDGTTQNLQPAGWQHSLS